MDTQGQSFATFASACGPGLCSVSAIQSLISSEGATPPSWGGAGFYGHKKSACTPNRPPSPGRVDFSRTDIVAGVSGWRLVSSSAPDPPPFSPWGCQCGHCAWCCWLFRADGTWETPADMRPQTRNQGQTSRSPVGPWGERPSAAAHRRVGERGEPCRPNLRPLCVRPPLCLSLPLVRPLDRMVPNEG